MADGGQRVRGFSRGPAVKHLLVNTETDRAVSRFTGMAISRTIPISDEIFRTLSSLVLASRGAYAFIEPELVSAVSERGWCTPSGEITPEGESAFLHAQEQRANGRKTLQTPATSTVRPAERNPAGRSPLG
jgi:hypothetical protein